MAKSTRSKVKRHFRAKKRESGVFAAAETARLNRLSAKLAVARAIDGDGDVRISGGGEAGTTDEQAADHAAFNEDSDAAPMLLDAGMALQNDSSPSAKKISTHGSRNSRREQWRASKGMNPRPTSNRVNRQGVMVATRKAGRAKRRR